MNESRILKTKTRSNLIDFFSCSLWTLAVVRAHCTRHCIHLMLHRYIDVYVIWLGSLLIPSLECSEFQWKWLNQMLTAFRVWYSLNNIDTHNTIIYMKLSFSANLPTLYAVYVQCTLDGYASVCVCLFI